MSDDKIFADGLLFKRRDNAPEWVVGSISIKVDDFTQFCKDNADKGWVNLEVKKAKSGKFYAELDTWKPTPKDEAPSSGGGDEETEF
jgi:hypothetical protein